MSCSRASAQSSGANHLPEGSVSLPPQTLHQMLLHPGDWLVLNSRRSRLSLGASIHLHQGSLGLRKYYAQCLTIPWQIPVFPLSRPFAVKRSLEYFHENCPHFTVFSYHTAFVFVFVFVYAARCLLHTLIFLLFFFMTRIIIQTYTPAEDVSQLV